MSESTESNKSCSSTSISTPDNLSLYILNEKLIKNISILIETLINLDCSKTLKRRFAHKTSFDMKRIPVISIYDYLYRIIQYTQINDNVLIKAIIYIDRIIKNNYFSITYNNIHKLLFIAIVLSAKINDDNCLTNKLYSKIGGISVKELKRLEIKFCECINYRFYIKKSLFEKYYKYINID